MVAQSRKSPLAIDRAFRWSAVVFAVSLGLHAADHVRRGMASVPPAVMVAGTVQTVLAAATLGLVFTGNRWAAHSAIVVGFLSAVGFTASHMLPTWSLFSDSFIDAPLAARVTWFSWMTAIAEILADVQFALVGVAVLRARRGSRLVNAAIQH